MTLVLPARRAPSGWRADARYVDVRRARRGSLGLHPGKEGYFGNPYPVTEDLPVARAVAMFRAYAEERVLKDPEYREAVKGLSGKTLVCQCDGRPCHAYELAEIADRLAGAGQGLDRLVLVPEWTVLQSVRYATGRASYAVGVTVDDLVARWPALSADVRRIILDDLEREFRRDDHSRDAGREHHPLGHDMDRQDWERVRALGREGARG